MTGPQKHVLIESWVAAKSFSVRRSLLHPGRRRRSQRVQLRDVSIHIEIEVRQFTDRFRRPLLKSLILGQFQDHLSCSFGIEMVNHRQGCVGIAKHQVCHATGLFKTDHGNSTDGCVNRYVGKRIQPRGQEEGVSEPVNRFQIWHHIEEGDMVAQTRSV